jgi:hypothetical protein
MAHPDTHEGALLDELDGPFVAESALVPSRRSLDVSNGKLEVMNAGERNGGRFRIHERSPDGLVQSHCIEC